MGHSWPVAENSTSTMVEKQPPSEVEKQLPSEMEGFPPERIKVQSGMERCSIRNDENATGDPSTPSAAADSGRDDTLGGGLTTVDVSEFSGQILRLRPPRRTSLRMTGLS